jgi:Xaa-Pro aminopeptidase
MQASASLTPKTHLPPRLNRARQLLDIHNLDALLLTHPADLQWLTDFTGEDSVGILTRQDVILATDFRFEAQAAIECPQDNPKVTVVLRDGKMSDLLAKCLADTRSHRVGFESTRTTFAAVDSLQKSADALLGQGHLHLIPLDSELVKLRAIKDPHEIATLRKAVDIAQKALTSLLPHLKPGLTESNAAGMLYAEIRRLGAGDTSFESIIASGPAAALPHYRAKDLPIRSDTVLLIDYGARYQGYCSDLTRTFFLGKVPDQLQHAYRATLEAQERAIAALKPGMRCKDADAVARDYLSSQGYTKEFGHSLGHGIGLDIHEQPGLRKSAEDADILQPGMVVTIEPGVYLPGLGGIRIEDDVLITDTGYQVLSSLPKSFDTARLT